MKTYLVLFLLFPALAFAAGPNIHFQCRPELPTTAFIVSTHNDMVKMTMIQASGPKYIPIYNGVVTPSDLDMLQQEAVFMSQIPEVTTFTWPAANCKDNGDNLYECWRGGPTHVGNTDFDSSLFYTHRITEKEFDTQLDWYRVTFSLKKDQQFHDIVMDYFGGACIFD